MADTTNCPPGMICKGTSSPPLAETYRGWKVWLTADGSKTKPITVHVQNPAGSSFSVPGETQAAGKAYVDSQLAGTPMPSASESAAIQTLLTSVAQALPTNGAQPLVAAGAVALPTTPASALQVVQSQILPVINPNQYRPPTVPLYARPVTWATVGIGLVGLLGLVWVTRRKSSKKH